MTGMPKVSELRVSTPSIASSAPLTAPVPAADAAPVSATPLAQAPDAALGAGAARVVQPRVGSDSRTSPSQAVLGGKPTAPVAPTPAAPVRAPTLKPPAVIGSTGESAQTTGPTAAPLNFPPNASISLWALPGATIRVYNTAVLEDGKPKLLKELTAPLQNANTTPHCMSGAWPTAQEFNKAAAVFAAAKAPGMLLASVPLGAADDHSAHDTFLVTQQAGSRPESEAVPVKLFSYSAPSRPHQGKFEPQLQRMALSNGVLASTEAWALRPGSHVEAFVDGSRIKLSTTVDDSGKFALDLGKLKDLSKVVVTANGAPLALGKLGLAEQLPDARARVAEWDAALLKGLMSPSAEGKVDFVLCGLPEGLELTLTNPNSGSKTFRAEHGTMHIELGDTWPGDTLVAKMSVKDVQGDTWANWYSGPTGEHDIFRVYGQGKKSYGAEPNSYKVMMDGNFFVPEPAQAERIGHLIDAMKGYTRDDLQNVIELFGPHAKAVQGCGHLDGAQIRRLYEGARLGAQLSPKWAAQVTAHLAKHGESPDVLEGIKIGQAYRQQHHKTLASTGDDLGLRQVQAAQARIVVTGGYSPISGSHGPLTPETVYGSATWALDWKDLPPLPLMTEPQQPSGWVNPAAYAFTFGVGGSAGVNYVYTPSS